MCGGWLGLALLGDCLGICWAGGEQLFWVFFSSFLLFLFIYFLLSVIKLSFSQPLKFPIFTLLILTLIPLGVSEQLCDAELPTGVKP